MHLVEQCMNLAIKGVSSEINTP